MTDLDPVLYNRTCCYCHRPIPPGSAIIVVKAYAGRPGALSCDTCRHTTGSAFSGSGKRVIRSTKSFS